MSFIDTVKAFFKTPKVDSDAVAVRNAFSATSDVFDTASHAIEPYTTRANHRYTILAAAHDPYDRKAYDEAVAAYTDPADFEGYTEAYLDAHTAAIDMLAAAFDTLTAAFAAVSPADNLYASAAALHKAYCDIYTFAAAGYSNAAHCAVTTALADHLQSAKDEFEAGLLEDRAAREGAADPVTAKAKAAAFKSKAAEDAAKAIVLEQRARAAETKAEILVASAKAARAKVDAALESACGRYRLSRG